MRTVPVLFLLAACASSSHPNETSTPVLVEVPAKPTVTVTPIETAAVAVTPSAAARVVVEFVRTTTLLEAPRPDAERLGVIKKKARAEVTSEALGDEGCARWIQIAPKGWTCESSVIVTSEPATTATPVALDDDDRDRPSVIRATYGMVRRGATAFANRDEAAGGEGRVLAGSNTVRAAGSRMIDGKRYWLTSKGDLIDASKIVQISPSSFKGVAIAQGAAMPGWIRGRKDPTKPVKTRAEPGGRVRGEIAARTVVTIQEESADGRFVRVTETAWVPRADVRMAAVTEPPEGTGADEKWFDVDLDTQILVAYEGTRPVYATLVSTGKYGHWTPTLIARVQAKHESTPMTSDKGDVYSVADVPWTMFYDGHYALHTSYWHNGFGGPRSHGCINLAPRDARLLYQWSSPDVPPGWTSVYGTEQHPGSLVRVHAAKLPAPKFRGYAKRMREAAGTVASSLP